VLRALAGLSSGIRVAFILAGLAGATSVYGGDIETALHGLKQAGDARDIQVIVEKSQKIGKCSEYGCQFDDDILGGGIEEAGALLAFASFSIPDRLWLELSTQVESAGGVILLRGLPESSFKKLAQKLLVLRDQGVNAPIQIDPQRFTEYGVDTVPVYVVIEEGKHDKITGNISLTYALDKILDSGETKASATRIKERLAQSSSEGDRQ